MGWCVVECSSANLNEAFYGYFQMLLLTFDKCIDNTAVSIEDGVLVEISF